MTSSDELDFYKLGRKDAFAECQAEIERLRAIIIEANNFWRHDFSADVEAAADRLFKKLSANNTDPLGDRRAERERRAALSHPNQTGGK